MEIHCVWTIARDLNILSVASEGLKGFCNLDGDLRLIRAKENDDFDGLAIQYWKAFRLHVFVVD